MGTGLNAQQAVQQVVALPRPEADVPRVDVAPRAPAARPKHARAMAVRQRERPFQLGALEVLRTVTLDDPEGPRVRRQRGGVGEHAVDDEPFVRAEGREVPLRQPPLERGPRLLDRKSTRLNSSHGYISYAVFCLKKKKQKQHH